MPQAAPSFESEMANIRSKHMEIDDDDFFAIVELAHDYTILTGTAQWALYKAIEYIVRNGIPDDIVECGGCGTGAAS